MQEVGGSIPPGSTSSIFAPASARLTHLTLHRGNLWLLQRYHKASADFHRVQSA
jgi:hypothetical protein